MRSPIPLLALLLGAAAPPFVAIPPDQPAVTGWQADLYDSLVDRTPFGTVAEFAAAGR